MLLRANGIRDGELAAQPSPIALTRRALHPVKTPELPQVVDPRCALLRDPTSPTARTYRLLRHQLLARSDPRVIVVTSALKGEGKTTCAINLALCIADETFARVLLLEANRQRPSLARVFGVPTLHDGGSDLATTSRHRVLGSSGPRLHIASALAYATHCGGLDRALFGGALHELREVYDYIVVDTASVLESADVDVAAECAGGVIVAARAGRSRRGPLERAIAQLSPANVCGVVLLDI